MTSIINQMVMLSVSAAPAYIATQPQWIGVSQRTVKTKPSVSRRFQIEFGTGTAGKKGGVIRVETAENVFTEYPFNVFPLATPAAQIDPNDYEVRCVQETNQFNPNYTTGGAARNVWHSLKDMHDNDLVFEGTCTGRYGGFIRQTLTIRNKTNNTLTASQMFVIRQDSDVKAPTYTGPTSFTETWQPSDATGEMGFYLNSVQTPAENTLKIASYFGGAFRTDGGLINFVLLDDDNNPIDESEFNIAIGVQSNAPINRLILGGYTASPQQDLATFRANASPTGGYKLSGSHASGSAVAELNIFLIHKQDTLKSGERLVTFTKNTA